MCLLQEKLIYLNEIVEVMDVLIIKNKKNDGFTSEMLYYLRNLIHMKNTVNSLKFFNIKGKSYGYIVCNYFNYTI